MNRARVVALVRQLAQELGLELAAAVEDQSRRVRPEATLPIDEVTRARVRATMRKKGYRNVE
jgi:hypothetical protein